ncbi:MAG: hypothetical protein ACHQIM_12495 [Sphingobacteriales bacterium]
MKAIYFLHIKLNQYTQRVKSAYEIVFLALLLIGLLALSTLNANHTVAVWASALAGLTTGVIAIKMPAIINYVKLARQKSSN